MVNERYCPHGAILVGDSSGCYKCGVESRDAQVQNLHSKIQALESEMRSADKLKYQNMKTEADLARKIEQLEKELAEAMQRIDHETRRADQLHGRRIYELEAALDAANKRYEEACAEARDGAEQVFNLNKRVRDLNALCDILNIKKLDALEKERDSVYQTLAHTVFERDVIKKRLMELEGKQNG